MSDLVADLTAVLDRVEALAKAAPPALGLPVDYVTAAEMLALVDRDRDTVRRHSGHGGCPNLLDAARAWGVTP